MIVVRKNAIWIMPMHYREVMEVLQGDMTVLWSIRGKFVDAGYIVLDLNKQVVVNGQCAIPVGRCLGKSDLVVLDA